jgi:hypothetical protein
VENAFVRFDFKQRKVLLEEYIFDADGIEGYFPLDWCLEGSNDDEVWDVIDRRCLEYPLREKFQGPCRSAQPYRYIRLRQNGPNAAGTHQLQVSHIEFFGSLGWAF